MPVLRRLLLLRDYGDLPPEEKAMFRSYEGRVSKLLEYAEDPVRTEWSFAFEGFHNLTPNVLAELYPLYRALFDVSSYYQHNTAGVAVFLNSLVSKLGPSQNLRTELDLKHLPDMLLISGHQWIGKREDNVTTDVVNRIGDTLVFIEFKSRIDTGCTAGRREVWETKFLKIIQHIVENKMLYTFGTRRESLSDVLKNGGINCIEMYLGILFDIKGNFATVTKDKDYICYGGMVQGYERVLSFLDGKRIHYKKVTPSDDTIEDLLVEFGGNGLTVRLGAEYANGVIDKLFKGKGADLSTLRSVTDSLVYDDLWLSQLLAISERSLLFSHGNNYLLTISSILERDLRLNQSLLTFKNIRYSQPNKALVILNQIIAEVQHKGNLKALPTPIMVILTQSYLKQYTVEDYIADIIQVLASVGS